MTCDEPKTRGKNPVFCGMLLIICSTSTTSLQLVNIAVSLIVATHALCTMAFEIQIKWLLVPNAKNIGKQWRASYSV